MVNRDAIRDALSTARLAPYVQRCGGNETAAFDLYVWNANISAAFLFPLGQLKVVIRNAIHHALTNHAGTATWSATTTPS